ncbi:hypothetical protein DYH09_02570 [bacterium CPR1]|nr:hypothetical protein [bacterium CPR1]
MEIHPEFYQQKRWRLPWQDAHEVLPLQEVVDRLERGQSERLLVKPPDSSLLLPLCSSEDLQEVRVFSGELGPEKLAEPELGAALQDLCAHGWLFEARPGQVGAYGAYNALTEPARSLPELRARKGEHSVALSREVVGELRDFVLESPLARLEEEGYVFLDERGEPASAYLVGPRGKVGRDGEAWLPAAEATPESLSAYRSWREAAPDAATAARAWELAHRQPPASMGELARELPWALARKAGQGAPSLTAEEVRRLAADRPVLELAEEARRTPELAGSIQAGQAWEAGLDEPERRTLWHTLLTAPPVQDEKGRLQAFQSVLEKLPESERSKVLQSELARAGADPLLVGQYARQAKSDLMPLFDKLGLEQPGIWNAAVNTAEGRRAVQDFFLHQPHDGKPVELLRAFWQANRTLPNDQRARLVRALLSHANSLEENRTLAGWLQELDPKGDHSQLLAVLPPVAGQLAREWCQVVSAGHGEIARLLLETNPPDATAEHRVGVLSQLWKRLPSKVDNAQRAALVRANLAAASDDAPSRRRLASWLLELEGARALTEVQDCLASPELESWLGALTSDRGRALAAEIALDGKGESTIDRMRTFWKKAGSAVPNEERARLCRAELDRLQGQPDSEESLRTLGAWLVELTGEAALPRVKGMLGALERDWLDTLQEPKSRSLMLSRVMGQPAVADTPSARVELLKGMVGKLPREDGRRLVERNLEQLAGRRNEEGAPAAVLTLLAWKAQLGVSDGVAEYLASDPATKPLGEELSGWLGALTVEEARSAAVSTVLTGPVELTPEARVERMRGFWKTASRQVDNTERARLVDWSAGQLAALPPGETRDRALAVHASWTYELKGEQGEAQVLELLSRLPSRKTEVERLIDWRQAVSQPSSRKVLTEAALKGDLDPDPVELLRGLWQANRYDSKLPNEDRAALVSRALSEVTTSEQTLTLVRWLYELKGDEALEEIGRALRGRPETVVRAEQLDEWLASTRNKTLRQTLVPMLLGEKENVLYEALVAVRSSSQVSDEERIELVRHRTDRTTDPDQLAPQAEYLRQLGGSEAARPALEKLGAPWARVALAWGEALETESARSRAYQVWLENPSGDRSERLGELFSKLDCPPEEKRRLLRWELGQLDRQPVSSERDQAVGRVGALLADSGGEASLPVMLKLLEHHLAAEWAGELLEGATSDEARRLIGRSALENLQSKGPVELGLAVLKAYQQTREVAAEERLRVTEWTLSHALDPKTPLAQALPPCREFLEQLGEGLLQPAGEKALRLTIGRFSANPTVQISLGAQAERIAAAPNHSEAQRLVREGMQTLELVQGNEDMLRARASIEEREEAVVVGGVRVPKREELEDGSRT